MRHMHRESERHPETPDAPGADQFARAWDAAVNIGGVDFAERLLGPAKAAQARKAILLRNRAVKKYTPPGG